MTQPNAPRRMFFRQALAVVPATALAAACTDDKSAAVAPQASSAAAAGPYVPRYFTAAEWAFLHAACDRLIPDEEPGAGAIKAGVPQFIDGQMETPYGHGLLWYMQGPYQPDSPPEMGYQLRFSPRDLYRAAIADIDAYSQGQFKKTFAELDEAAQLQLLVGLEKGKVKLARVSPGVFFDQLLENTKEGYFADPQYGGNQQMAGWKMIGFPGARADYADWVSRPGARYPLGPVSMAGEQV